MARICDVNWIAETPCPRCGAKSGEEHRRMVPCYECWTSEFVEGEPVHKPDCSKHPDYLATPQQEPEGDGWEPKPVGYVSGIVARREYFVSAQIDKSGEGPRTNPVYSQADIDRLRARVQPRRVGEEVWVQPTEVRNHKTDKMYRRVFREPATTDCFRAILITPEEEDDGG